MSTLRIMDYNVEFPYEEPYEIQKLYMEKVIQCLHNKLHGVLESPTGTGKTLCLLAPISAWVKVQKIKGAMSEESHYSYDLELPQSEDPKENKELTKWGHKKRSIVWYTARTHSQIAQTIAEVRKCNIRGLNVRVLGARDQLCINPEVLNEKESYIKTLKCKELIKAKNCKYYRKLNQERDVGKYYQVGEVMDIEDLVTSGKTCGVCPYYLSKLQIETADIVFLPYNYIIDKDSRDANGLQFQGDVVIFDEGHNVPNTCEESYEFSFSSLDLALGIRNITDLMKHMSQMSESVIEDEEVDFAKHAENAIFLVEVLQKLESGLNKFRVSEELLPVSTLYEFFGSAGINNDTVNRMVQIIEDFNSDSSRLNLPGSILSTFHLLEKMANTIFGSTVRSFDEETINRSFKCGVRMDPDRVNKCKRVSLYCFNPSFGIRAILHLGVQSIIITSGTLSPLKTFIHELHIPKPVTLENGHIAKKSQVPFLILGTGVNNVRMDAAFTNRTDPQYMFSLGMSLTNLISSVPDGVLLLFSSYSMMQSLKEAWEGESGIWKRLNSLKRVFEEPRGKDEFIDCMENYRRAIDSGNGAVLMGVLRGKISEGMDFKNQYCRAVFIIGVPFPPTKDPRVKGKEKYAESLTILNPATNTEQKLYNNSFMSVEAMKATNQAIGRVIRHGQDYGAIILVDYRFCWFRLFSNISGWLRGLRPEEKNFPQAKKILREFFRDVHLGKLGVPEVRCQRVDANGCPVASYVSYEEYEHKKASRTPAPWIKASGSDEKSVKRTYIEYKSDNFNDIASLYSSSQSENRSPPDSNHIKVNSVFDAIEHCRNTFPGYGEMDRDVEGGGEKPKRKYEEDGNFSQSPKHSCLDKPLGTAFAAKATSRVKKPNRIKIKPFLKGEEEEPESVVEPESFMHNYVSHIETFSKSDPVRTEKKDEDKLKINLVNYFKWVPILGLNLQGSEHSHGAQELPHSSPSVASLPEIISKKNDEDLVQVEEAILRQMDEDITFGMETLRTDLCSPYSRGDISKSQVKCESDVTDAVDDVHSGRVMRRRRIQSLIQSLEEQISHLHMFIPPLSEEKLTLTVNALKFELKFDEVSNISRERNEPTPLRQIKTAVKETLEELLGNSRQSVNRSQAIEQTGKCSGNEGRDKLHEFQAKGILTESEEKEFKKSTAGYMKGEKSLLEIVTILERIFNNCEKRKLFSGFSICVKPKDREEWGRFCETKIDSS